jgi:hypothetical protein
VIGGGRTRSRWETHASRETSPLPGKRDALQFLINHLEGLLGGSDVVVLPSATGGIRVFDSWRNRMAWSKAPLTAVADAAFTEAKTVLQRPSPFCGCRVTPMLYDLADSNEWPLDERIRA